MKQTLTGLAVFLITLPAFSQEKSFSILGRVVDSASQQPLNGASVFCPNTTQGTITNGEGYFFLRLPNGGYELAVSYTGYNKKVIRISNVQPHGDTLLMALSPQDQSLEEVAVVATNEVANGWQKYGRFLLDHFIGTTPNAAQCFIENPEAFHFYFSKKRNRLKVLSKEDIIVLNYALGYKIHYQLDSFTYDYTTKTSQYTGYPLFEEMDTTEEVKTAWVKNRAHTYLGSRLHFMRSYYDSTLAEDGFVIEKLSDDPNIKEGTPIRDPYDSSFYAMDSSVAYIDWAGRYRILYRSVWPDPEFLREFNLPADTRIQPTVLSVADGFAIEENGYFYDQNDVINSGYWAWKKLAEALPYDYDYE